MTNRLPLAPGLGRAAAIAAAISVSLVAAGLVIPGTRVLPWFVPVVDALTTFSFTLTAWLAFLDARLRRDRRALPIVVIGVAGATLWSAHLVLFPGDIPGVRGLAVSNVAGWLYLVGTVTLPLALTIALVAPAGAWRARGDAGRALAAGALLGLALVAFAVTAATLLATVSGDSFSTWSRVAGALGAVPAVFGLVLLRRGRHGDPRVITSVAAALVFAVAVSLGGMTVRGRYGAMWYALHALELFAVVALLLGQLLLYRRSVEAEAAAAAREHEALGEAELRVAQLGALIHSARTLTALLDRDAVLTEASRAFLSAMSSLRTHTFLDASILRLDGEVVESESTSGVSRLPGIYRIPVVKHPAVARAIATDAVAWCDRDEVDSAVEPRGAGRAVICAPVRMGGRLFGVIGAATEEPGPFQEAELALAQGLADVVGLALGNAEHHSTTAQEASRLAALEKIKTDFLRVASHELRGPLALIRGYLSMLEEGSFGEVPDKQQVPLGLIDRKANEMSVLVDQLVDAARLEESVLALNVEDFDLREAVRTAVDSVRLLEPPRHQLLLDEPLSEVLIQADRQRIATMVQNLVDNAVKYSPDGGRVDVRVRHDGGAAVVEVEDEGVGIAGEDLPRLFTRFGRITNPATMSVQGTGLGLYLVREIARMHGGDVEVESTPGRGSRFSLRLPAYAGSLAAQR